MAVRTYRSQQASKQEIPEVDLHASVGLAQVRPNNDKADPRAAETLYWTSFCGAMRTQAVLCDNQGGIRELLTDA